MITPRCSETLTMSRSHGEVVRIPNSPDGEDAMPGAPETVGFEARTQINSAIHLAGPDVALETGACWYATSSRSSSR